MYTEEFYEGLTKSLRELSRDISYVTNRIEKIYCYDLNKEGMNPYLGTRISIDKDYSIILRKELIYNLNQEHFNLEAIVKSDVELIFGRIGNIRRFLKFYKKGVEELESGQRFNAGISLKNSIKVMKDDITDFIINKYKF